MRSFAIALAERQMSSASASSSGGDDRCRDTVHACCTGTNPWLPNMHKPRSHEARLFFDSRVTSETLAAKKRYREEQKLRRPPSDHGPPPASFAALGELAAQQGMAVPAQQDAVAGTEEQEGDQVDRCKDSSADASHKYLHSGWCVCPSRLLTHARSGIYAASWLGCRVPLVADKDMASMTAEDMYRYCMLPPEALPEAFPQHNTAPTLPMLPKSGCKGLQVHSLFPPAVS